MITIPYYETSHFVFSNFSAHPVEYNGVTYPTAEHAFHGQKFDDTELRERVRTAKGPLAAWKLGKEFKPQRKANWNDIKVGILTEIIRAKTAQNDEVREALLASGDELIVEHNPNDDFWGDGADGKGA